MQKKRKARKSVKQQRDRNAKFVGVFFTIIFMVLCGRIVYHQVVNGEDFRVWAAAQQTARQQGNATRVIPAARGGIVDRHMQPIASTIPIFEVFMDVTLLHDRYVTGGQTGREDRADTIDAVHRLLGVPTVDMLRLFETNEYGRLARPNNHHILAREVDATTAMYLRDNFTHLHATERSMRVYHDHFFAPQVVGFMRGDARWGLEAFYYNQLVGAPGRVLLLQGEQEEIPVQHGYTLITTLDSDIQREAQASVDRTFSEVDAEFVAMIVMDPFTGEIIAMAQAPNFSNADPFNPGLITDPALQARWDYLTPGQQVTEMQRLWRNFHTTRAYEPGSIFKPIVIAAALEEGIISPNEVFFCNRTRHIVAGEHLQCWHPVGHGRLTLTEAIYRSCNVAMFYIIERMGRETFYRYRGYFGIGERTGIDLPGEDAFSHPSVLYTRASLGPMQLATSSMGQGFATSTLQSITAFAALINGGNMLQPFVVSQIVDNSGNVVYENRPPVTRRVISQETSDFIRREMQYVISADSGTAARGRIPGHTVGGKTGTGQQGVRADGINSLTYIAFTPVENPEFLVIKVVDRVNRDSGGAGAVLSPRVANFLEEVIRLRGLPPSYGPYAVDRWQAHVAGADLMPDYSGQRLIDAVRDLSNRSNGGFTVVGSGTRVLRTMPLPGQTMPQNSPVIFHMDTDSRIEGQMTFVPDLTGLTVTQAQSLLAEVGLSPMLLTSIVMPTILDVGTPQTTNRLTAEELAAEAESVAMVQMQYVIYQQFPAPGTALERGTLVMFRAR